MATHTRHVERAGTRPYGRPGAPEPEAEAEQREERAAITGSTPTPTQHENDAFRNAIVTATLPPTYAHAMDGSPIDMSSLDPTAKTTSFP